MGIMTIGTMTWRNKSIRQISIIRRDVLIAILENSKKNTRGNETEERESHNVHSQ